VFNVSVLVVFYVACAVCQRRFFKVESKRKLKMFPGFSFQTYRISVRTITTNGEESSDRSAVLTVGKGKLTELLLEYYGYRLSLLFKSYRYEMGVTEDKK